MLEIKSAAGSALAEVEESVSRTLEDIRISPPRNTEGFIDALAGVRTQIGHLHTVRERRQIDTARVDELIEQAETSYNSLAQTAAAHLASDGAFAPCHDRLVTIQDQVPEADSSVAANDLLEQVDAVASSMDVVASTVSDLVVDDPPTHHDRALAAGAVELSPLQQRDWTDHVAYSLDPDGHVIAFARTDAGPS